MWYVLYGTIITGPGAVYWLLITRGRFTDGLAVMLMAGATLWLSASNHHADEPKRSTGDRSLDSYDP